MDVENPPPPAAPDPAPLKSVAGREDPREVVAGREVGAGGDEVASPPVAAAVAPTAPKSPSLLFLAVIAIVSFVSDIASKLWAEKHLDGFPGIVSVWKDHIAFILAKNKGGAWGLLQATTENVRRPFFLLVSVAAIAFIMTLYRRLLPTQRALKWGLPMVLGGALGNVFDRIRYGHVIDFIDVHATLRGRDHHWPTFNVADIAICVGVGLMAVDMFTSRRPFSRRHVPADLSAPPVDLGSPLLSGAAPEGVSLHVESHPSPPSPQGGHTDAANSAGGFPEPPRSDGDKH